MTSLTLASHTTRTRRRPRKLPRHQRLSPRKGSIAFPHASERIDGQGSGGELYDDFYYAHDCGEIPYERNETWLELFDGIAKQIITEIRPQTVLDAGCAMGFLVEQLRRRGVEAYGVDISAFAIEHVHESIQDYCNVGSIIEPFEHQHYDLIVNIEVLEHMTTPDAKAAIENLCRHTNDIIFSSTPFDYREVTHFNVRPPEYWSTMFAHFGFYRDTDFDASFVNSWAVRFRRRLTSPHELITEYERKFWQLWKENIDIRGFSVELQQRLSYQEALALDYKRQYDHLSDELTERNIQATELYEKYVKQHEEHTQIQSQQHETHRQLHAMLAEQEQQTVRLQSEIRSLHEYTEETIQRLLEEKAHISSTMRASSQELEDILTQKNEHIHYLETIIRQLESGQVMRLMQTLNALRSSGARAALQTLQQLREQPALTGDEPTDSDAPYMDDYALWIIDNEPNAAHIYRQRKHVETFPLKPLISIITPVYNPDPDILCDTIESVIAQTYGNWELCLADGCSTKPGVQEVLKQYATKDSRVRVHCLEENCGISGNSNAALEMARGTYIALLDHDDLLAPSMLYEVALLINQHTDADIVYFDEDKATGDGKRRLDPLFKPDCWSPDHLLATNYLMHSVIRRSLVVEVGGFNTEMDGSQDWDLLLRCTEKTDKVYHIPRVLYHWRQVEGSAALSTTAKPWAFDAQSRCVSAHLQRIGADDAQVVTTDVGRLRVMWKPSGAKVSIIITSKEKVNLLRACISSVLQRTTYPNYEIILVDTGSNQRETLRYYAELESEPRVQIVQDHRVPFNFSAANNYGVTVANGDILLFLNNDTEVLDPDWLDDMVGWAERPGVGVVGAKLIRPNDILQHTGLVIGLSGHAGHVYDGAREGHYDLYGSTEWYRNYQAVTGACLMMPRSVFEEVNGFDEVYQIGYSDIEICLSATRKGYRAVYTPFARLIHHEGGTRGYFLPPADVLRAYCRMISSIISGDPYYNPNLSSYDLMPALKQPNERNRHDHLLYILHMFDLLEDYTPYSPESLNPCPPCMLADERQPIHAPEVLNKQLLMLTDSLTLHDAPVAFFMLACYLKQQGYTVTVLSPSSGPLRAHYAEALIEVIVEPSVLKDARTVYAMLPDYGILVVNTIQGWRAVYAARAFQRQCIWWLHYASADHERVLDNNRIATAVPIADAVVLPSRTTIPRYAEYAQDNIVSIPYGLDPAILSSYRAGFIRQANSFTLVVPGDIERGKGQDLLLRVVATLPEELQMQVYCVGQVHDWKYYRELREQFAALEDRLHIVGDVTNERANAYIRAADVCVFPYRDEELPLMLVQALYHAKPIIASDAESMAGLLEHGTNAMLVRLGNDDDMQHHLTDLYHNKPLRESLGANARVRFEERCKIEHSGQKFIHLIEHILHDTPLTNLLVAV